MKLDSGEGADNLADDVERASEELRSGKDEGGRSLMPILDTTLLADLLRGRKEALALLTALEERAASLNHADHGPGA